MSARVTLSQFSVVASTALSEGKKGNLVVQRQGSPCLRDLSSSDENRKAWEVFRRSLQETIGLPRYQAVCERYSRKYQFADLEQYGQPLLPEHVQAFSAGSFRIKASDVFARAHKTVSHLTREQLQLHTKNLQPLPSIGPAADPKNLYGNPTSFRAHWVHDPIAMDRELQTLFSDVAELSYEAWLERFAKAVVNRDLVVGQILPVCAADDKLDYYQVYAKVIPGKGFVAYALQPCAKDTTLSPLIVFRPTQFSFSGEDAVGTHMDDFSPEIGQRGWEAAEPELNSLMSDRSFLPRGKRVSIAGFSLGGAYGQHFLAEHYARVKEAFFYADPSVSREVAAKAAEKINQMPRRSEEPLLIHILRTRGDVVPNAGEVHVGHGVTHPDVHVTVEEVEHAENLSKVRAHSTRIADAHQHDYVVRVYEDRAAVNVQLDNAQRGEDVAWYEKARMRFAKTIQSVIAIFERFLRFLTRIFGIEILRHN